jgi:hypothetical protein
VANKGEANKGEANKGRQSLRLADEDSISLAGDGDAGAFAGLYDRPDVYGLNASGGSF